MNEPKLIPCHTCERHVRIVRSVKIRGDTEMEFQRLRERFPDPNSLDPDGQQEFHRCYAQYIRNADYRRAFICQDCYAALDILLGIGVINVNGQPRKFNLSSSCRFGRAATYDYPKWQSYQKRAAHQMGLSIEA